MERTYANSYNISILVLVSMHGSPCRAAAAAGWNGGFHLNAGFMQDPLFFQSTRDSTFNICGSNPESIHASTSSQTIAACCRELERAGLDKPCGIGLCKDQSFTRENIS